MVGARAYLEGCWNHRSRGSVFFAQDGPPGFELRLRNGRHEWLRQVTVLTHASDDPLGRLTVSVMMAIVAEGAQEVVTSGSRADADEIMDAATACGGESFTPDTRVLLATGGSAAIASLTVGTQVLATDTKTGSTTAKPVQKVWVNHNTVQLARLDDVVGWMVGAWPVGVLGAFDVPSRVFAFDDSGVRAEPPFR